MILLIDAGNTRIKWALVEQAAKPSLPMPWLTGGAVSHGELEQLVQPWQGSSNKPDRVCIANVAGPGMRARLEAVVQQGTGLAPEKIEWFASEPYLAGVRNGYRDHRQLGCDRFASVIGAHALFPGQALIVATCGTATTVDAVAADGLFLGGMILPGIGLMAGSLARNTAQLPQIALDTHAPLLADNTDHAILAGCLAAQAGAVERACRELEERLGMPPHQVQCLLSGGAAPYIEAQLRVPYRHVENLVLIGVYAAAVWPG